MYLKVMTYLYEHFFGDFGLNGILQVLNFVISMRNGKRSTKSSVLNYYNAWLVNVSRYKICIFGPILIPTKIVTLKALCHDISSDCFYISDLECRELQTNAVLNCTCTKFVKTNIQGQSKAYTAM